jgi:hypothetical protein
VQLRNPEQEKRVQKNLPAEKLPGKNRQAKREAGNLLLKKEAGNRPAKREAGLPAVQEPAVKRK